MSVSVQLSAAGEVHGDLHQHCDLPKGPDEKNAEALSAPSIIPPVDHDSSLSTPSPNHLERWNQPRRNMYRFFTTLLSFIILGANDGAIGVSSADRSVGWMLLMLHRL